MKAYSERYEAALTLAAQAHQNQVRKVGDVPYIVHAVHVSVILIHYGFSEDVAIGGLLHDVVEDQDIPLDQIESDFGPVVAEIVAALTEWREDAGVERTWEVRKQELLAQVQQASPEAIAVKAADTLHSTRTLAADLRREGPSIWNRFSRGPGPSLRYYKRAAAIVRERLADHPLVDELVEAVHDLGQAIVDTGNG